MPAVARAPATRRRVVRVEALLPHLALAGILILAAALLLWELPENGWGNAYYATAVHAAARSWSAFWTASLDLSGTVSVDKTPLSIWMMALSARIFGFTPAALLVPNALCALGSVALLNALVRRAFGSGVGLLAALFLALTPALVAVGRFDNPDALLVLLLLCGAYAGSSALETGRLRSAIACGVCIGLAFNTKMLQAYLILPALLAAAVLTGRRGAHRSQLRLILAAAIALMIVSLAWIGAVSLLPAGSRPWVGDTTTNSWWQLVVGANGVGRISGAVIGGGAGSSGPAPLRLLQAPVGGQIAWLLPLAAAGTLLGAQTIRRRAASPKVRGALGLWIGWALVHVVVFSLLGLFHAYYTSALAPAVAALAAIGASELWGRRRASWRAAAAAGAAVLASIGMAVGLLAGTPDFLPWLVPAIVALAAVGTVLAVARVHGRWRRGLRVAAAVSLLSALLGAPAAYSLATTERQLAGIDPLAGPSHAGTSTWTSDHSSGRARLIRWLIAHRDGARYLAAVDGSLAGAPIELLSGRPVLIMGGFAGSDPAPSTAQLSGLIHTGQVRTVILSSAPAAADGAAGAGLGGAVTRGNWVRRHCVAAALATTVPAPNGTLTATVYRCAG